MDKSFQPADLMTILEGISDTVVKLDGDANYNAMNNAAVEIFRRLGREPQDVLGKCVWELFPDVKGTIVERKIREALENQVLAQYESFYPADQHWYAARAYPSHPRGYSHLPRHYTAKSYKIRLIGFHHS